MENVYWSDSRNRDRPAGGTCWNKYFWWSSPVSRARQFQQIIGTRLFCNGDSAGNVVAESKLIPDVSTNFSRLAHVAEVICGVSAEHLTFVASNGTFYLDPGTDIFLNV